MTVFRQIMIIYSIWVSVVPWLQTLCKPEKIFSTPDLLILSFYFPVNSLLAGTRISAFYSLTFANLLSWLQLFLWISWLKLWMIFLESLMMLQMWVYHNIQSGLLKNCIRISCIMFIDVTHWIFVKEMVNSFSNTAITQVQLYYILQNYIPLYLTNNTLRLMVQFPVNSDKWTHGWALFGKKLVHYSYQKAITKLPE